MKVDETLESVGHVWQQVTVLILLHLVVLMWAVAAGAVHFDHIEAAFGELPRHDLWPAAKTLHAALEGIGLGLPAVAGIACVIYTVAFQRFSLALGTFPVVRLRYSEPDLWREGLCFDQLRRLIHRFKGYTASSALEDIEVTLGLAVAQYSKEFKEHYEKQVGIHLAKAELWTKYHSGLWLLLICSLPVVFADHALKRALLLPLGLLFSILVTRCCWEAEIERLTLARLRFAIDCSVISEAEVIGEEKKDSSSWQQTREIDRTSLFSNVAIDNYLWDGKYEFLLRNGARATQALSGLYEDVELAVALMRRPEWQRMWALRIFRKTLHVPIGALPRVKGQSFRDWILWRLNDPPMWELCSRTQATLDQNCGDFSLLNELQEWKLRTISHLGSPSIQIEKGWDQRASENGGGRPLSFQSWLKYRLGGVPNRGEPE